MPRRDGTGPMGTGAMTGKGFGFCTKTNAVKYGAGLGLGLACRCGFRGGFGSGFSTNQTSKELLLRQKDLLQTQLDVIETQLNHLV